MTLSCILAANASYAFTIQINVAPPSPPFQWQLVAGCCSISKSGTLSWTANDGHTAVIVTSPRHQLRAWLRSFATARAQRRIFNISSTYSWLANNVFKMNRKRQIYEGREEECCRLWCKQLVLHSCQSQHVLHVAAVAIQVVAYKWWWNTLQQKWFLFALLKWILS